MGSEIKILSRDAMFAKLEKDFGKGSITTLSRSTEAAIVHWTSTGCYALDEATNWGLAGGRIVEYFGAESSGKTTEAMAALIENERRGGQGAVYDSEGTFDQDRYVEMGGNPETLIICESGTLEEFYDKLKVMLMYARGCVIPKNAVFLIVVDTLTMIQPKAMLEAEGDEQPVAAASRVNARHLPTIDKTLPANTCLLLLSQVRDKVGAAAWGAADSNIDTPGGRIVKHVCSTRVFFNKMGQVDNGLDKEAKKIIGMKIQAKVVKSKIGPPLRKADFRIMFDKRGVDNLNGFLLTLVAQKLIPAPKLGVYSIKDVTFKADGFAEFVATHPKWTARALDQCYTLEHTSIRTEHLYTKPAPKLGNVINAKMKIVKPKVLEGK